MITQRKLKIKVDKEDYYTSYLNVMNGVLNITKKEVDILSWFMERENFYIETHVKENVFSKANRRLACEHLEVTPHYLNNYIKSLKDKNIIKKTNKGLIINPSVFIEKNEGARIEFELEVME